jgi:uridine kinase
MVAIGGCSGSGKTTLARRLAEKLGGVHFHFDHYYRDLGHLSLEERAELNFDDPAMLEQALLLEQLTALGRGEWIEQPVYDFAAHTRLAGRTEKLRAGRLLVVEGIFALYFEAALPRFDLRVFVETPEAVCLQRRIRRDTGERGRSETSVRAQWARTVQPSAERFVLPTRAHADLIVRGDGDLEQSLRSVIEELEGRRARIQAAGSAS